MQLYIDDYAIQSMKLRFILISCFGFVVTMMRTYHNVMKFLNTPDRFDSF